MAVTTGSIECLHLLLSLGADSKPLANQDLFTTVAMTGSRDSPEHTTAIGNRILLSLICSVVHEVHFDESKPGEAQAAVQDLLNGRYQVQEEDSGKCGSPLELCLSISNYDSVFALLDLGADPNSVNYMPSLHVAVSLREPMLTALLLSYGADPNLTARDDNNHTPLHQADTTSLTTFYEPPRNRVTSYLEYLDDETDGKSAIAVRTKACIAVLLSFGADIEAQDCNGDTALMRRIIEDDFDIAEYLLSQGANLHAKDFAGYGIFEKAKSSEAIFWCVQHSTS